MIKSKHLAQHWLQVKCQSWRLEKYCQNCGVKSQNSFTKAMNWQRLSKLKLLELWKLTKTSKNSRNVCLRKMAKSSWEHLCMFSLLCSYLPLHVSQENQVLQPLELLAAAGRNVVALEFCEKVPSLENVSYLTISCKALVSGLVFPWPNSELTLCKILFLDLFWKQIGGPSAVA